jgi:hypothetical protein
MFIGAQHRSLALFVTLSGLAVPTGASAAAHKLGVGSAVRIAIAPKGTAHVVWHETGPSRVVYCRVPAGASACDRKQSFTAPPSSGGYHFAPPAVFAFSDARIIVSQTWCCFNETWVAQSTNGGTSFGAAELVAGNDGSEGATQSVGGEGESILAPGPAIVSVDANLGPFFQRAPLGLVTARRAGPLGSGDSSVFDASVGRAGPATVVSWLEGDAGALYSVGTAANLNETAAWGPRRKLDPAADRGVIDDTIEMASGPGGLFVLYSRSDVHADPLVRKWNGSTFGAARKLATESVFAELAQDPAGHLHAVWKANTSVTYRYSTDGAVWNPAVALVPGAEHTNAQLAASASGRGAVAYELRGSSEIFLVRLPPDPVTGVLVNLRLLTGKARTACRGQAAYTALVGVRQIPVGCLVDSRNGQVRVVSARGATAGTQSARFSRGLFRVQQKKSDTPTTAAKLTGSLACKSGKGAGRSLRGRGARRWRIKGARGSATVVGSATWTVTDRCDGSTAFRVDKGTVDVRDAGSGQTVTLHAGGKYVAPAKGS